MPLAIFAAIPFPNIDPIMVEIGPFAIHWYAVAYLVGLFGGWRYIHWLNRRPPVAMSKDEIDDLLVWIMFGVVLGGRLGYVLFYNFAYYLQNPIEIVFLQRGGMSFHGGLGGVILAIIWFARKRGVGFFTIADLVSAAVPIGLFLGRLANFINAELYGRVTDVAWGMVFPRGGPDPRHPSQLYEAFLEGFVIFFLLLWLARFRGARARPGLISGVFFVWYGCARIAVEFVREPDAHLGFLFSGATMGQLLSLPVLAFGLWLIHRARKNEPFSGRKEENKPPPPKKPGRKRA